MVCGCGKRHGKVLEIVYVSAPQAILRDHMSAVFNKTGVVKNGDSLDVLERDRRFVRVRDAKGEEGWLEQRYVVGQAVYDGLQSLAQQEKNDPVQANGTTHNDTNIHLTPGRETDHLYQLTEGTKVAILKRSTVEKNSALPAKPAVQPAKPGAPAVPMEDWSLIRDPQGRVGWVLARMIDVDLPMEVSQYAEGQRVVAYFALNEVTDGDKKIPEYLVALTEPKDGMQFDYNQIRVFTWNLRKHRYETAYREHGLTGVLPITLSHESFDKEGTLPVFVLRVRDEVGNVSEKKYKLSTPMVKRVLAPGEAPPVKAARRRR